MYIENFDKISTENLNYVGGKGKSLSILKKSNLPVPDGFIILSKSFFNGTLLSEAKSELENHILKLDKTHTYAVRSSAIGEDGDNASFAGAYETILDVKCNEILKAVLNVAQSASSKRVKDYAKNKNVSVGNIAIVVQRFINPDYAGVLFTSDYITGSAARMLGNYVDGVGEALVSGSSNAKEFTIDTIKYKFNGDKVIEKYAKKIYKYATKIRNIYGVPQDIEWAVKDNHVYILQARPITSLIRYNSDTYLINGSLSGEYLFSKTNVGEIFMQPLSPATYGILDTICKMMGIDCFIDNIYGQAYCNLSVICSTLVALGIPRKKAYSIISDIAGNIPEDVEVPIFPVNRKKIIKKLGSLLFAKKPKQSMSKKEFRNNISNIADELIKEIRTLTTNNQLSDFWVKKGDPFMTSVLQAIMTGLSVKPLLSTRNKLISIAGEELANELCSNCSSEGVLESMKPLLGIEDIIQGKMTKEEYIKKYGHRCANEMELACPYPYENPNYVDELIRKRLESKINAYDLKQKQEKSFNDAVNEFISKYPNKAKWLNKTLRKFAMATYRRENIRSQSVKIFCVLREFLLQAARLNDLGNDIFMLHFDETIRLLNNDKTVLKYIEKRRKNYNRYLEMPQFPNQIYGRFEPESWIKNNEKRLDFYSFGQDNKDNLDSDIKGFSGAAGVVTGNVRVLTDLKYSSELKKGEILVTTATNIGWTPIFPLVSGIVTDIGAPLSHAAIVAREFGIPAVVGCMNATSQLKTGDIVTVDGIHGTVTKIS